MREPQFSATSQQASACVCGVCVVCVRERQALPSHAPSPLLKIPTLPLRENLRNIVLMELRLLRSFIMSACADSSGGGREMRWADMGWVQGMESGKRPVLREGRLCR